MKKIQPFTIGTKLSVPNGAKCHDCVDIVLPAPALESRDTNDRMSLSHGQTESTKHNPTAIEDGSEEERDSVSPAASLRSIRKIAICGMTEMEHDCAVINLTKCPSTCEPNQRQSSAEKQKHIERKFVDKSFPLLETEPWRKMKNLQYDYGIPAFPIEHPGDASISQERDLKDFENSLIQLTTSLDLKDDAEGVVLKKATVVGECTDKSWLKIRTIFQEQQELVLALDVSAFYHHADAIINTINSKKSSLHATNLQSGDRKENEIRKISSQIKMLNESAALLSTIHPVLASRVARKQAEVKESWAVVQDAVGGLGKGDGNTQITAAQNSAEPEPHGVMEKHVKEEQNRLRGAEDPWVYRMLSLTEEPSSESPGPLAGPNCRRTNSITENSERDQLGLLDCLTPQKPFRQPLTEFSTSADSVSQSLLETHICVPLGEDEESSKHSQEHRSSENEELLGQMEVLWEGLRKRYELVIAPDPAHPEHPADKEFHLTDDETAQMFLELPYANHPPKNVEECRSGMLEKFLELLDHRDSPALQNGSGISECNEAFPGVSGDLNKCVCAHNQGQSNQELLNLQLSTLTLRMNEHLAHCAELSMDMLDMEADVFILCDPEHCGVGCLQEQQDGLEVDYLLIEREVEGMEILVRSLQVPLGDMDELLTGEVQPVLQIWEEVRHNMEENRERLAKFNQLRDYFTSYLELIEWTESTRSAILSGSTADQWKDIEVQQMNSGLEQKLLEFDQLAAAGQRLEDEGNYPKETIKERTEELRGMLGWIQANWKTQREQLSQKKNLFVNMDPLKREEMQSTAMELGIKVDFPGLAVQESYPVHSSLSSSIRLILSSDDQSACIRQVFKPPSLSSREEHAQLLPGRNKTQCQQSSITNSGGLQLCNESVIGHSKEQKKDTNPACVQQSQTNPAHVQPSQTNPAHMQPSQTNPAHVQQSQTNPAHVQPSQDIFQMQQSDRTVNQTLKQQSLGNIQIQRQQSLSNEELEWQQSPNMMQVQHHQSPGNMMQIQHHQSPGNHLESPTNNKEQRTEQKHSAESPATRHVQRQQLPRTTPIYHQLLNNIPESGDSEIHLAEKKQLIGNDEICFASPQNLDQLQNHLCKSGKEKTSSNCGQHSSQLILQSPKTNHMKDQRLSGKKPQSSSNNQTQLAAEGTHRVTTYLHVTDVSKLTDRPSEMEESAAVSLPSSSFSPCSQSPSSSSFPHPSLYGVISPQSCETPKADSVGLEQPMRTNRRRHMTLSIIQCAHCNTSSHWFRGRCNTWPEGRKRHPINTEHQGFKKEDSFRVICTEEPYPDNALRDNLLSKVEIPSKPNNNMCPYLSLGSTLRVSLPQDVKVLCHSASHVQSPVKGEYSSASSGVTDSNNQPSLAGGAEPSLILQHTPQAQVEMQPVTDNNSLMQPDHEAFHMLDKVLFSPISEKKDQQPDKTQLRSQAECEKMRSAMEHGHLEVKGKHQDFEQHTNDEQCIELKEPFTVSDPTASSYSLLCNSSSYKHNCLSVHTRIKDLNTHVYHMSGHLQWNSQTNSVLLGVKGPIQLADSSLGSSKLKRVVVCGERECAVCCSAPDEGLVASAAAAETDNMATVPRFTHQQFLEDEEELKDIWKGKTDDIASGWDTGRGTGHKTAVSGFSVRNDKGPVAL
ncbi:uncharacterized protein si:dkey-238i5.2 isoform X3 [Electrophorus electricus]|uniref:uncharacterized protein si:dkey-238i5.2 isoform X3 n=1 Tax=Electrophorus electricus TaxID=8005 RepID=UPI0015CFEB91|nr:uncharacterized protein si:dkey-238i5.2 isoform X3 [Electrophorus electricus]